MAVLVDRFVVRERGVQSDQASAAFRHLDDFDRELRPDLHATSGSQLSAGRHHRLPQVVARGLQEQDLGGGATVAGAQQPGLEHAGGVQDEKIAGGNEIDELTEPPVLDRTAVPPHDHEAARLTLGQRLLGDAVRRQLEVVVAGPVPFHASNLPDG
jgi:hypothetical protein